MSEKENEPPVPSPEEISKKLTDFFQENFGQSVGFSSFPDMSSPEKEEELPEEPEVKEGVDIFDFNYLPKDICAHLDRFVIRQEEAKKALSIAVCDHYNHAKYIRRLQEDESQDSSSVEFAKQNVVIVVPMVFMIVLVCVMALQN